MNDLETYKENEEMQEEQKTQKVECIHSLIEAEL